MMNLIVLKKSEKEGGITMIATTLEQSKKVS